MISRIFHPIGQGAFYSELHEEFNIVYDCGNWKTTALSENVVRQSFTSEDVIDILFISHFDWDHISRIGILKDTVKQIKHVVMPLLHDNEKIFITNIHRALGVSSNTLINKPNRYFGENVNITYVEAFEGEESLRNEVRIDDAETIASGSKVPLNTTGYSWVFIPYNIENKNRSQDFENSIAAAGFDVERLRNDPSYTISKIRTKTEKNKIKKIYNSIKGKINQNSMVVYSGCEQPVSAITWWSHKDIHGIYYPGYHHHDEVRVSCIYTGDVNLNDVNLESVYRAYWKYVGTLQIPHHGSLKDFDSNSLTRPGLVCPISYGKNNTYGHPSLNVISQIKSKGCFPLQVTDDLDTGAVQLIELV